MGRSLACSVRIMVLFSDDGLVVSSEFVLDGGRVIVEVERLCCMLGCSGELDYGDHCGGILEEHTCLKGVKLGRPAFHRDVYMIAYSIGRKWLKRLQILVLVCISADVLLGRSRAAALLYA